MQIGHIGHHKKREQATQSHREPRKRQWLYEPTTEKSRAYKGILQGIAGAGTKASSLMEREPNHNTTGERATLTRFNTPLTRPHATSRAGNIIVCGLQQD